MAKLDDYERVEVRSPEELRAWLAVNYTRTEGVWLVHWKKKAGAPFIGHGAIVDELICYGWIDSLARRLDDDRTMQLITPRKRGSGWSAINKEKVERLEREGRIAAPGRAAIDAAKEDGSWSKLDEASRLTIPPDLAAALAANPAANRYFDAFPASSRRAILEWIGNAKQPATREKRIRETVERAAENERANQPAERGRPAGRKASRN